MVQPAAFLRTTLPLSLDVLADYDSGRYHSIWLPDHMVSFWPDSIWTPEFTDLATVSPSPHRHLDGMAVAAAAAVLTARTPLVTSVVDTVRRHPAMLAQTALTVDHLSGGRFILGLGSGELENTAPYGFDFAKPVSRFEEAIRVIKTLWESDGPVDFAGDFFRLEHARLDTELVDGRPPLSGSAPPGHECSRSPAGMPTDGGRTGHTPRRLTPRSSRSSTDLPSAPVATRGDRARAHPDLPHR